MLFGDNSGYVGSIHKIWEDTVALGEYCEDGQPSEPAYEIQKIIIIINSTNK